MLGGVGRYWIQTDSRIDLAGGHHPMSQVEKYGAHQGYYKHCPSPPYLGVARCCIHRFIALWT